VNTSTTEGPAHGAEPGLPILRQRVNQLVETVHTLNGRCDQLSQERERLHSDRDALEASQQMLRSECDVLLQQRDALQAERDALQRQLEALTCEVQELTRQRQEYNSSLETPIDDPDGLQQEHRLNNETDALVDSQQVACSQYDNFQAEQKIQSTLPAESGRQQFIAEDGGTESQPQDGHSPHEGLLAYDWGELALETDGNTWSRSSTLTREILGAISKSSAHQGFCIYKRFAPSSLCRLFDFYGSDKGSNAFHGVHVYSHAPHSYGHIYEMLFAGFRRKKINLLECGIGSTNPNTPSNMGPSGCPGASLRAWRDFFPRAAIYGIDIDPDCLFEDDRIHTCQADQLDPGSIRAMWNQFKNPVFDVIIDDGLHTAEAALTLFHEAHHYMGNGGLYIIEDLTPMDLPIIDEELARLGINYHLYSHLRWNPGDSPPRIDDNNLIVIPVRRSKL
jgi:hypothetical protein